MRPDLFASVLDTVGAIATLVSLSFAWWVFESTLDSQEADARDRHETYLAGVESELTHLRSAPNYPSRPIDDYATDSALLALTTSWDSPNFYMYEPTASLLLQVPAGAPPEVMRDRKLAVWLAQFRGAVVRARYLLQRRDQIVSAIPELVARHLARQQAWDVPAETEAETQMGHLLFALSWQYWVEGIGNDKSPHTARGASNGAMQALAEHRARPQPTHRDEWWFVAGRAVAVAFAATALMLVPSLLRLLFAD